MKTASLTACTRFAILVLASSSSLLAQTQPQPSVTYDPVEDEFVYLWQTDRNRTFFPQSSLDLGSWDYFGALHFGPGSHVGRVQNNAAKGFFRLQYSDLPVATESEAETADFDRDGLTNLYELQESHTDPLGSDTDSDGLPDGWEVAHSISPLDDGSIDPQNGPDGVFPDSPPTSGGPGIFAVSTNANAFHAGVQDHHAASYKDLDGDGIANEIDAGPQSRAIDWTSDGSAPFFINIPIPGYNSVSHGIVLGCSSGGDVIASKALFSGGGWVALATAPTGTENFLPLAIKHDERTHRAYLLHQPIATSMSDDGVIVGTGTVHFETFEEELPEGDIISHEIPPQTFAFIWDSWATPPRILAHPPGSILQIGERDEHGLIHDLWDEYAQVSNNRVALIRQKIPKFGSRFQRFNLTNGSREFTSFTPIYFSARVGENGVQAYNLHGGSNALCWLPTDGVAHSLLAESTFKTPNPRSFFFSLREPAYIGLTPGTPGKYCLNFWDKAMVRHENRWQEVAELGDAMHITTKGVAFRSRIPNMVQVWRGGKVVSLTEAVPNKDFSSLYFLPLDSTSDGRVLANYYGVNEANSYSFLVPVEITEVISDQIVGNETNKLPTAFYGGHSNNPMLMATRTGTDARLAVKVNVHPSHASSIRVGVRIKDDTTIINSVTAVASPAKTLLSFTAQDGSKTYEVVAGFDANANSALDPDEAKILFRKTPLIDNPASGSLAYTGTRPDLLDKFVVVTENDFTSARSTADGYGLNVIFSEGFPTAANMVSAFSRGLTSIPGSSAPTLGITLDASVIPSPDGLSHPVGGNWNSSGQTTTHRLTLPVGSDLSDDVVDSAGISQMYGRVLSAHSTAIEAAATYEWGVVTIPFSDNNLDFATSDELRQVHVALGKCRFAGTLEISVRAKPGGGIEVRELNCNGSVIDLYDWAYGAPKIVVAGVELADPKNPARTQAGFATLAPPSSWPNAGRVFFTEVQIGTGWFDYEGSF